MGFFDFLTGEGDRRASNNQIAYLQQGQNTQNTLGSDLRGLYQPSIIGGGQAQNALASLAGLNGPQAASAAFGAFREAPGTAFAREQGMSGLQNTAAANGALNSGNTLAALSRFNQGLADQNYGNYLNQLMALQRGGAGARNSLASGLQGVANANTSLFGQIGGADARGITAQQAARAGTFNNALAAAGRVAGFALGGGIPGLPGGGVA